MIMVCMIKEVTLLVALHTCLLEGQELPTDLTSFAATAASSPRENHVQFFIQNPGTYMYNTLKIECFRLKAPCPSRIILNEPARKFREFYLIDGFVAGAEYNFSAYTESMIDGETFKSTIFRATVETYPAPLKLFNVSYVEVEDTNNIQSTQFKVQMQLNYTSNRPQTILTTLYHIEPLTNRSVKVEEQSIRGRRFRKQLEMTVSFLIDDKRANIDHPLPGHKYKFVQEVKGKSIFKTGLEAERLITMPPFPPKDLTRMPSANDTTIVLSWKTDRISLQDKIILKICRSGDKTNCIKEISLSGSDERVSTQADVFLNFDDDEFLAYAIAQSNGTNSSDSNSIKIQRSTVSDVKECMKPENLNGYLTDVTGGAVSVYLSDGSSYSLACDTGYSFAVGDGEPSWTCGDDGEWIGSSRCTAPAIRSCDTPSTPNGKLVDSKGEVPVEYTVGAEYSLVCNRYYSLQRKANGDISWMCNENGHWVDGATCVLITSEMLLVASGGLCVLAVFIIVAIVFIRCTRKKKAPKIASLQSQRYLQQFSYNMRTPMH